MRLHILAAATGVALALAGCVSSGGLHPDGKLTDPGSLHAERSLAGVTVSPAAWPSADWWTALGDSQLDTLIVEALKSNPDLAIADARVRQASAQAGAADAARSPTLGVGASLAGARLPTSIAPKPVGGKFEWFKYGYGSFEWNPDLWGGKRDSWEAAVGASRAAEIDARAARIELSTAVARAYAQLGYAFNLQDVAKAELDRANQFRTLTLQRVHAGIDNKLQAKQTDTEVASAEERMAVAERAVDSARTSLSVLLGQGPDRGLDIQRPQVLKPATIAVPADLPVDLLGRRADLVAARWRVESSSKEIDSAKADFMPNVSVMALAALIGGGSANIFNAASEFYQVAPAISLPIFDGGRRRAALAGKDAEYDLAVAQYNKTLVGALNEVADDLDGLKSLNVQIEAQQRALDAATQAFDLAQQRYKAGVGSYLESLTVREQLFVAERGVAELNAQQVDLSVQLIRALGGGFHATEGDQPVAAAPTNNKS
jgi:NodT family efflux transporter outer membrane factor (OMF) lipoprotein